MTGRPGLVSLAFAVLCLHAGSAAAQTTKVVAFDVLLDGSPVGQHRFSLSGQGGERTVEVEADFDLKLFGISVYRYKHRATERWRGGCLVGLQSTTDDNGRPRAVKVEKKDDKLVFETPTGREPLSGCVMSFAYWNPAVTNQSQLLNPQNGDVDAVQFENLGADTLEVRGRSEAVTHWRINGPKNPIELWYSAQGDWVGLASTVIGGKRLTYRLK